MPKNFCEHVWLLCRLRPIGAQLVHRRRYVAQAQHQIFTYGRHEVRLIFTNRRKSLRPGELRACVIMRGKRHAHIRRHSRRLRRRTRRRDSPRRRARRRLRRPPRRRSRRKRHAHHWFRLHVQHDRFRRLTTVSIAHIDRRVDVAVEHLQKLCQIRFRFILPPIARVIVRVITHHHRRARLRSLQHRRHELFLKRRIHVSMSLRARRARLLRPLPRRLTPPRPLADPPPVDDFVQVHPHAPQRDLRAALQRVPRLRRQSLPRDDFKRNRPVVALSLVIKRRAARRGVEIESTVAFPRFLLVSLARPRDAPSRRHRAAARFDAEARRRFGSARRRDRSKFGFGLARVARANAKERRGRAWEISSVVGGARASRSTRASAAPRPRGARALLSRARRLLCDAARGSPDTP